MRRLIERLEEKLLLLDGIGHDRSDHGTVVEYAVRELFKRKSPATAAKNTVKKLSGYENFFLGKGVTLVDAKKLEAAIFDRIANVVIDNISHVKEGMEHIALDMAMNHFVQGKLVRKKVKSIVIKKLGKNPFSGDV